MKRILLIVPLFVFLWFCSGQVLSHVVSIAIDMLLGYYVLFLLCNRIVTKNFNNHKEMFEEYKIIGVVRVVLATFFDFGDVLDPGRIIKKVLSYFKYNSKQNIEKDGKPHIKSNKKEDIKVIFGALIKILSECKKNGICNGVSFKQLVENNFADKWGYFYHSKYVGSILGEINNLCRDNNLSEIGILCTYNNGTLSDGYIENCRKNNSLLDSLNENTKITDKAAQDLIKNDMLPKLYGYKKILSSLENVCVSTDNCNVKEKDRKAKTKTSNKKRNKNKDKKNSKNKISK